MYHLPATHTRWSSTDSVHHFAVHNPATGAVLATVHGADAAQVDAAVRAAHHAFNSVWRWTPARERGKALMAAARVIREHADELAALETAENGKPLTQARQFDLEACMGIFEYFGSLAGAVPDEFIDSGSFYNQVFHEPHGVVGAIIPFNWPPIHTAGKLAPALATGNTVVVKPGEQAPLTLMRIVELIAPCFPDDVIQVVPGLGATAGQALAAHPLVRKVSFTGATKTGIAVLHSAAEQVTPALLELGGKNALVLLDDADVDAALPWILDGAFFNQGEACTAASRLLVHRSLYAHVIAELQRTVPKLRVGDGQQASTHVGPLVTRAHQQRVLDYVQVGIDEGAQIIAQAAIPSDPALQQGFFVAPTVFAEVTPQMRIAREEIFGPVTCVIPFDTDAQAVQITNDTDYGLVTALFSRDVQRAQLLGRAMDVGLVCINNYVRGATGLPFGGVKGSGYGREHALETLRGYTRSKVMRLPSGMGALPQWPVATHLAK